MICRSTLMPIKEGLYSKKAAKALFGAATPIGRLPFSRRDFFTAGRKCVEGMSISGVQQKLSLVINSRNEFETVSIGGEYILKPSPESFPNAAENEQCAMAVSRMMGIPTAWSTVVEFPDGELAYLTRRYDRANGRKRHQEDLAQGFGLTAKEKYEKSYEEALHLAHGMSGGKLSVVRDLFDRVVFAYLIGNSDMHLKNISLIREAGSHTGRYDGLAPNYDQLFTIAFDAASAVGFLALDLLAEEKEGKFSDAYQKYGFYTGSDFQTLGKKAGLPGPAIHTMMNRYFTREQEILRMIQRSFMPPAMKKKASTVVRDRIDALRMINSGGRH